MNYIIGFLKAIFVFMGILMGILIPGYLFQAFFKMIKIRFIGLLIITATVVSGLILVEETKSLIFVAIYVMGIISFVISERKLKKGYKEIRFVSENINMSWAALYAYSIPAVLLVYSSFGTLVTWSLYIALGICIIIPTVMLSDSIKKIGLLEERILKRQHITPFDIVEVAQSLLSENDKLEDFEKRLNEIAEIIDYFVQEGKLLEYSLDSLKADGITVEGFPKKMCNIYVTFNQDELIQQKIDETLQNAECIKKEVLVEELRSFMHVEKEVLFDVVHSRMTKKSQYIEASNFYMTESYISKLAEEAFEQCETFGDYNLSQIAKKFEINPDSIRIALEYRKFEYKNLSFSKREIKSNIVDQSVYKEFDKGTLDIKNDNIEILDINFCTEEELSGIPSMGVALAKKAIKHRNEIQGYRDVEEMLEYLSVKPHLINNIKKI